MSNSIQISDWYLVPDQDPYKAPELQSGSLCGKVTGHPRFPDGHEVRTTTISHLDGDVAVTVSGSRYLIGEPRPDYEELFPNARERLFAQLNKLKKEA